MGDCKRCNSAPATVEITVEYYETLENVVVLDELGVEKTLSIKNEVCAGCETFYKNYIDPDGVTIENMGLNKSVTYKEIT